MNASPQHVVLLGDSIFDNALFVPDGPAVIDQLRELLPDGWHATLLALDGAMVEDVARQLNQLPTDATHLVISVGGNDALGASQILIDVTRTAAAGMQHLAQVQSAFRKSYQDMVETACSVGSHVLACTVYDACPGLPASAIPGLSMFNDVILFECFGRGLPVLDLRLVCDAAEDYSDLSPIEPSKVGGAKIARAIHSMLLNHDFAVEQSVVYGAA